jgi:hypothetical protein
MLIALHWSAKCAITQAMIRSQMKSASVGFIHRDTSFPVTQPRLAPPPRVQALAADRLVGMHSIEVGLRFGSQLADDTGGTVGSLF